MADHAALADALIQARAPKTAQNLMGQTKGTLVEIIIKVVEGPTLALPVAGGGVVGLNRVNVREVMADLPDAFTIIESADRMIVLREGSMAIDLAACTGDFDINKIPSEVKSFLSKDTTTESVFFKYAHAHNGCPIGRGRFMQSDYLALLRVFAIWRFVKSAGYVQAASAGEAHLVNASEILLDFARSIVDMATGLKDVDTSIGKFNEHLKAKAMIAAKNAKALIRATNTAGQRPREGELDRPAKKWICYHCGTQGHAAANCPQAHSPRIFFNTLNTILSRNGFQKLNAAGYIATARRN